MHMQQFAAATAIALALGVVASAQSLTITSPAFQQGGQIPSKFTCDAGAAAVNPQLVFGNVPAKTQSLVLIMDDPDVPKTLVPSGEFVHWLKWDIAPTSTGIAEGEGKDGINGMGKPGYMGPCPPDRSHRYFFKLYALDTKLTGAYKNKAELEKAMEGHIIQRAELMANYERVKK